MRKGLLFLGNMDAKFVKALAKSTLAAITALDIIVRPYNKHAKVCMGGVVHNTCPASLPHVLDRPQKPEPGMALNTKDQVGLTHTHYTTGQEPISSCPCLRHQSASNRAAAVVAFISRPLATNRKATERTSQISNNPSQSGEPPT